MIGWKETGGKETGQKETGGKETGRKKKGRKETGAKVTEGKATGAKAPGAQDSQEMGGKGDILMDNMLPGDTTAGQNATEVIRHKSYFEVVIEGVRRKARVFVGFSIIRKTDRALNKEDNVVACFSGTKIEAITEGIKNCGSGPVRFYFSTRRD